MEEVQDTKWKRLFDLKDQDTEDYVGEEYEVPNEIWHYTRMFDSQGRYHTDSMQELAHDRTFFSPGLFPFVQQLRQHAQLQTHPREREGFFAKELPSAEEMAGWYDIVCYCSAGDDGYRNGRSNEGLMKMEANSAGGNKLKVRGELRPTSQQFLKHYCGLRYAITEVGRSDNGEMEIEFEAPDRFAEDMEVTSSAKLRILNGRVAMRLDAEERGGHPDYGLSIPLDEAERLVRAHQRSKSKESAPVLYFEKGDVCINSNWVHMGTNRTEVAFIARKRSPKAA